MSVGGLKIRPYIINLAPQSQVLRPGRGVHLGIVTITDNQLEFETKVAEDYAKNHGEGPYQGFLLVESSY